jgi:hypothetical protein
MPLPREVIEAAEAIKNFEKNDNPDSIKGLDFGDVKQGKSVQIDHVGLINSLVKFVSFVRMPSRCKEVMLFRLANPGISDIQIAMALEMRVLDVAEYEAEGKMRVCQALNSTSVQDGIEKFNRDSTVENAVKAINATEIIGGSNKLN